MSKQQARPYKALALLSEPQARLVCHGDESFILSGKKSTRINQVTYEMLVTEGWITEQILDPSGLRSATLTHAGRTLAARIAANAGRFRQMYAPWAEADEAAEEEALAALAHADAPDALPTPEEAAPHPTASEELQPRPQWVNWSAEQRGDGIAKPPYTPGSADKASTNNPASWGTYPDALKAVERGQHTGIGYVFSQSDEYTGIDLDKCRYPPTGRIAPWALRIVDRFHSYTEVSPSGTGLHILVRGTLPGHARRRKQVEAYSHGQYFTWTGDHLPGTPETIEACQEQLNELYQWLSAAPSREKPLPDRSPENIPTAPPLLRTQESTVGGVRCARQRYHRQRTDEEVLVAARRAGNAARFCRLYDRGDISGHPSHSEADYTLCLMLCYWTNGDTAQMDRLFRRSALMSAKWDRRSGHDDNGNPITYGQRTLASVQAKGTRAPQVSRELS